MNSGADSEMKNITQHNFVKSFKYYVNNFIKEYDEGLFALVWALITFGLERLLDKEAFNCPRTGYQGYGIAFFVSPIVMLTLLNWLSMPAEGGHYVWSLFKRCWIPAYHRRGEFLVGFLSAFSVGLVAPSAWVFLALLDAQHLVCWELGYQFGDNVTESYLNERGFGYLSVDRYNMKIYEAKAKAHTASVVFLAGAVLMFFAIIILRRSYLKPFNPDKRMKSLCHFEEKEAFAAKEELDRLLEEGDEFDQFSYKAALVHFFVVKERICALQREMEDEKDDKKLLEIKEEITEFEELGNVLHFWAKWYKLNKMKTDPDGLSTKAKKKYEDRRDDLLNRRENRMKNAKELLAAEYENNSDDTISASKMKDGLHQKWLLTRLELHESYFDVDKLIKRWEESAEEIKRFRQCIDAEHNLGFVSSPELRGRIVTSYIVNLYKNQSDYCLTLEQLIEKFRSVYPRVATSDPTLRYIDVENPLYKHIIAHGRDQMVPLLYMCTKPWEKENDDKWEEHMLESHDHSWGWKITGCLKSYCPLDEEHRKKAATKQRKDDDESPSTKRRKDDNETPSTKQRKDDDESPSTKQRKDGDESPSTKQRKDDDESPSTVVDIDNWDRIPLLMANAR